MKPGEFLIIKNHIIYSKNIRYLEYVYKILKTHDKCFLRVCLMNNRILKIKFKNWCELEDCLEEIFNKLQIEKNRNIFPLRPTL